MKQPIHFMHKMQFINFMFYVKPEPEPQDNGRYTQSAL